MFNICCTELRKYVFAPRCDDKYIISYADKLGWFIQERDGKDKDTYPMINCVFCGKAMNI